LSAVPQCAEEPVALPTGNAAELERTTTSRAV